MFDKLLPSTQKSFIGAAGGIVTGGLNALYSSALQKQQLKLQKDWWYQQQKFLEEHNSPAYQSMKLRQAGLNPYDGVGSQPLGNLNSDLPGRPMELFNTGDIVGLMSALADIGVKEAQAENLGAQTKTEGARYDKLVQDALYTQILAGIGIIDKDAAQIKFDELKAAYEAGNYNPTTNAQEAHDKDMELKDSEIDDNTASAENHRAFSSNLAKQTELLQEQVNKLKRDNLIGDEFDFEIAQYEVALKSYQSSIAKYDANMSEILNYSVNDLGIDVNNLPDTYKPLVLPFVFRSYQGLIDKSQEKEFKLALAACLGENVDNFRKSDNPDYLTDKDIELFNHYRRQYNLELKKLSASITTESNRYGQSEWQTLVGGFSQVLSGVGILASFWRKSGNTDADSTGLDMSNDGNFVVTF